MGKTKHAISNWATYNRALVNRGLLGFWMDKAAINNWYCPQHHGKRGRGFEYSDTAIETALMLKARFKLPFAGLGRLYQFLVSVTKERCQGNYPTP